MSAEQNIPQETQLPNAPLPEATGSDAVNPMPSKLDEKLEERVIDKPMDVAESESAAGKKRERSGEEKGTGLDLEKQQLEQGSKEEENKDNDSDKNVDLEKKDELIGQDKLEQPVSKKPKLDEESTPDAADADANKALGAPAEDIRQEQVASNE